MDSKPCLVQINLYQSQLHPPQRGFVRDREGVTGTWWSPMPGGEESDRGAGGESGGEASVGASQSRSSHAGTDRGSVGRGRAEAGVGGRGLVAGASGAGMEQFPVRPASVGGGMGTPSRSRVAAVAAGGSAVSPADMPTVQRGAARAAVSVSLILAPVTRSCLAPARLCWPRPNCAVRRVCGRRES